VEIVQIVHAVSGLIRLGATLLTDQGFKQRYPSTATRLPGEGMSMILRKRIATWTRRALS
jgi:hypothetical protein